MWRFRWPRRAPKSTCPHDTMAVIFSANGVDKEGSWVRSRFWCVDCGIMCAGYPTYVRIDWSQATVQTTRINTNEGE